MPRLGLETELTSQKLCISIQCYSLTRLFPGPASPNMAFCLGPYALVLLLIYNLSPNSSLDSCEKQDQFSFLDLLLYTPKRYMIQVNAFNKLGWYGFGRQVRCSLKPEVLPLLSNRAEDSRKIKFYSTNTY